VNRTRRRCQFREPRRLKFHASQCLAFLRVLPDFNKCSVVAEMGDRLATIDMGRKLGGRSCVPLGRGAVFPSNTMWSGTRPTSLLSFILIIQPFGHSTSTSQTDSTDNGPIAQGAPFYRRSPKNKRMCRCELKIRQHGIRRIRDKSYLQSGASSAATAVARSETSGENVMIRCDC